MSTNTQTEANLDHWYHEEPLEFANPLIEWALSPRRPDYNMLVERWAHLFGPWTIDEVFKRPAIIENRDIEGQTDKLQSLILQELLRQDKAVRVAYFSVKLGKIKIIVFRA